MSVEKHTYNNKFEQVTTREIERKFTPLFPELLDEYRREAIPIEQFYLSHPSEPFSLRFRETLETTGILGYEATLKDNGTVTPDGLDRFEQTCRISSNLYDYYKTEDAPAIHKLRAQPLPGVIIDYYEDGSIQLESENPQSWEQFVARHGDVFAEVTGETSSTNEWKAHFAFRCSHNGREAFPPRPDLQPNIIIDDVLHQLTSQQPAIVHIGGRSGSGKTTLVNDVRAKLHDLDLDSLVLSTDDYHHGTTWLTTYNQGEPWTAWDEPIVYDTLSLAEDIQLLTSGREIAKREIDWSIAEPITRGSIQPASVIIIEGIYATSPDISSPTDLSYEMSTGLATCIGRRLLRDLKERPEFADPEKSLTYILEQAEPAYQRQRART